MPLHPETLVPTGKRYLVRVHVPKQVSDGGIHIPEEYQVQTQLAEVVNVGTGDAGKEWDAALVPGWNVLLERYGLTDVDGERLCIAHEDNVLAMVRPRAEGGLMPMGRNVIVRLHERAEAKGSLLVPEAFRPVEEEATVVFAGDECVDLSPGDVVGVPKMAGTLWRRGGSEYVLLKEAQVPYIRVVAAS